MWNVFNFSNFDDKFKNTKNEKEIFTHEDLRYYFEKLVNINLNNVNTNNFTELLRRITQITIWGDKHDDQIFQYFCEDNIFSHFIYLLRQDINKTVRIQVYQSLTLLIQNLQKDISLYYIFSNNKINNLIYTTFIHQDEEIIPYYISMMKSISFFLNYHTSKFFFNEKNKKFPLYTESLRLYKFNDIITRTYVKNIILNIFKIEDEGIENLILLRSSFFAVLVCYLRTHLIKINKIYSKTKESEKLNKLFNTYLDEIDDVLYFFEDMLNCNKQKINDMLILKLVIYFYFPIIGSFHSSIYCDLINNENDNDNFQFSISNEYDQNINQENEQFKIAKKNESFDSLYFSKNNENVINSSEIFNHKETKQNDKNVDIKNLPSIQDQQQKMVDSSSHQASSDSNLKVDKNDDTPNQSSEIQTDEIKRETLADNEHEKNETVDDKNLICPPKDTSNIQYDEGIPFLKFIDRENKDKNKNFKNNKNFDFFKNLSSSNLSSTNSSTFVNDQNSKNYDSAYNDENIYIDNPKNKENKNEKINGKLNKIQQNEDEQNDENNLVDTKRNSLKKKKGKKGSSAYDFLYFKGKNNSKKEKNEIEKKQDENQQYTNYIKDNDLKSSYFQRRKKKVYLQMDSSYGVLHKKRSKTSKLKVDENFDKNSENKKDNSSEINKNESNDLDQDNFSGCFPFSWCSNEINELKKLLNNNTMLDKNSEQDIWDMLHLNIPILSKKITFDANINNDIYKYIFNFSSYTNKVLEYYGNNLSVTSMYYQLFKLGLCLHPTCYVNSFKNLTVLYNYIINTNVSLFILIRSLNILKNSKINNIVYSLIFGEHIHVNFLHKILSNELKDPPFYNYFFDPYKKKSIIPQIKSNNDIDFENVYSKSIDDLIPEYNTEEERMLSNLIEQYFGNTKEDPLNLKKEENKSEEYADDGTNMNDQSKQTKQKEDKEGENKDNDNKDSENKDSENKDSENKGDENKNDDMSKYNELSNPILLNYILLTNIQKEKNIKKSEHANIKNKISDVYLLLSIQFIYNFIENYNSDLNNINISFFKISKHNFLYVLWDVINIHINNVYLRIITLKLLTNLTSIYIDKITDKSVCTEFCLPLLKLINKIKKKLASKIKKITEKMEYKACQIFWEECKIYENCSQEKITISKDPILISIINSANNNDDNYLFYPVSQIEIYRRNVHALFVLDGLSKKLSKIVSISESEETNIIPFDFGYNSITALIDIKSKNMIKCYLKNNNKIFNCYYIEDDTNFLLCVPSNSHANQGLIIFSYPLMLIDLYIDKNDNKKLIFYVYSYNNEENNYIEDSAFSNFNNSEKIFNDTTLDSNYQNPIRSYSSNNDDNLIDPNVKTYKNDYIINKYTTSYKKNKTITNVKKEWCHKELTFMKNVLKLNFHDTTRSLIVYKELKSGIQKINDIYKEKLQNHLSRY
ncbi:conserved Plasmodium protein, unknown function [Plasmodium vinckei lentum]|uniref:FPL domain-containing protein n=1 Tax=Plasmodium vinckei lentum TaxID=138297 RepID=A0A6V7SCL7_PLAVN|nr:conserved Plasmodium protein, unknown function [Plasmodium vinckei lentum]